MIDVILTTFNRVDLLDRTICSFLEHTDLSLINKIIISNDGSKDGTAGYLEELARDYPKIQLLPDPHIRKGLIPRFNEAFALCDSDTIVNMQDDIEFYPNWLELQTEALKTEGIHFVTGYDAPEHIAFSKIGEYDIKHSAGFIQLTAYRSTWQQWFPMEPEEDFPTPCKVNGYPIGSNIDTRIYRKRKNDPYGKMRYLVIPGMKHLAQKTNSTWRKSKKSEFGKKGAVPAHQVRAYWKERYEKQHGTATGFAGLPAEKQEVIACNKIAFILPWVNQDAFTVDYGCGTGTMSEMFHPMNYIGMDITAEFLALARERHPDFTFHQLRSAGAKDLGDQLPENFTQFMTCNVLQHNEDATVLSIFKSISKKRSEGFTFLLYENSHPARSTGHMRFRQPDDYICMVGRFFTVKMSEHQSHVVHGERHSIIRIEV